MSADELIVRSKAALAAWDCVHVVASVDVIADIPSTIEEAYRQAPGLVRDLIALFEEVHEWGHERAADVEKLSAAIEDIRNRARHSRDAGFGLIGADSILGVIERLDQ